MKKSLLCILSVICLFFTLLSLSVDAISDEKSLSIDTDYSIEYFENGDYIETIIVDVPSIGNEVSVNAANQTITKSKTTYYKNSSGEVMWSVKVTGTFNYNGTTSSCTSCSHSTTSPGSNWSITSSSCSRSGNKATATATAHFSNIGVSYYYTKSVALQCSVNGTVS